MRNYQTNYFYVTHGLFGASKSGIQLTAQDIAKANSFFYSVFTLLKSLQIMSGMFIWFNVSTAPYVASALILINCMFFHNPLAYTGDIDEYSIYYLMFKDIALLGCCCILFTRGKILESKPNVDFYSPFTASQVRGTSIHSQRQGGYPTRRNIYRSTQYERNDLLSPDNKKTSKRLNQTADLPEKKEKKKSYMLKRLE